MDFALNNGSKKKGAQLVNSLLLLLHDSQLVPTTAHQQLALKLYTSHQLSLSHESMALFLVVFSLFSDDLELHLDNFKKNHKTNKLRNEVQRFNKEIRREKPQVAKETNADDQDEMLKDLSSSPERAAAILAKSFNVGHIVEFEQQINLLSKLTDPISFILQVFNLK
jgi:hypothetical protein